MLDILELSNNAIPLQKRYDKFVYWINSKNYTVPEFIAEELGVPVSVVDVFFELGNLDEDEFQIIDDIKFDLGHLFIFIRNKREIRNTIYEKASFVLSAASPLYELKNMVDQCSSQTNIEGLVEKLSGNCLKSIAKYLKERNIASGTITIKFRSMLYSAAKIKDKGESISENMSNWIIRAIAHDKTKELGIFSNEIIHKDFHSDYQILQEIRLNIDRYGDDQ